jgi:hypothetical protein
MTAAMNEGRVKINAGGLFTVDGIPLSGQRRARLCGLQGRRAGLIVGNQWHWADSFGPVFFCLGYIRLAMNKLLTFQLLW